MKKVVSLFSGAGGFDIGFEQAGLDVIISQDFNKDAIKTQKLNGRNAIGGDLVSLIENDKSCSFLSNGNDIFCVVGGPPCQSFSTAGKRKGLDDPRGQLFNQYIHVVKTLNPKFFVFENVRGLVSSKSNTNGVDVNALELIINEFKKIGYENIVFDVLNSVNYGAPQFRDRLIIIGSKSKEDNLFLPYPTHFKTHQSQNHRWQTISKIKELEQSAFAKLSPKIKKYMPEIPEGGNWKSLSLEDQKTAMGGAFKSGGGKVGFFRRLSFSQPAPTLTTSPVQKSTLLCHPTEDRALSINEYAYIQGFPTSYKFHGSLASKYK
jgi:DNA (cytosine-5)-methyltransferase 1